CAQGGLRRAMDYW
nr:immunoglobulin heavy chain junction region [Mus musculus]